MLAFLNTCIPLSRFQSLPRGAAFPKERRPPSAQPRNSLPPVRIGDQEERILDLASRFGESSHAITMIKNRRLSTGSWRPFAAKALGADIVEHHGSWPRRFDRALPRSRCRMTMYREMDMPFWLKKSSERPASWPEAFPTSGFSCWPNGIPPVPDSISEASGEWHDS